MSKTKWFRHPTSEVVRKLTRELKASESAASLSRKTDVPASTIRMWIAKPETLGQVKNFFALLKAAGITGETIHEIWNG